MLTCGALRAQEDLAVQDNDIQQPIQVEGPVEHVFDYGDGITAHSFLGGAVLTQGQLRLRAQTIVVFLQTTPDGVTDARVVAKESRAVRGLLERSGERSYVSERAIRLQSVHPLDSKAGSRHTQKKTDSVVNWARPMAYPEERSERKDVRFTFAEDPFSLPGLGTTPIQSTPSRRIQIRRRSSQPFDVQAVESSSIPPENIYVITGGVNVLSEGSQISIDGQPVYTVVDLSADRVVIWMEKPASDARDLKDGLPLLQAADTRFQVYLEGNIVVRHSRGTIEASRAFYDAGSGRILALNAELRAVVAESGQQIRIHAERLRQLAADRFHAQNAWTTTSPYGKPGYRLQSENIFVNPGPQTPWTGFNRITGESKSGSPLWVTAENSQLIVGEIPLLSVPRLTFPAEDPGIPLRRVSARQDRIFGFQINTVWDLTKIFPVTVPPRTEWDLLADYYTKRGPAIGSQWTYDFLNRMGQVTGEGKAVYQRDRGRDVLSRDRRALTPKDEDRGQIIFRHRQRTGGGVTLFGEIGYLSDRNYLEQFSEIEFDEGKDVETIAGIRQDSGPFSSSLLIRPKLNPFETTTEWLPRGDIYSFSVPFLNDQAYWSSHSSVGYAHLDPTSLPTDPADPFSPTLLGTPYVRDADGIVAMSRHRIDVPFMLGPVNVNPWVMGEAAFWNEGLVAGDIGRLTGNVGIRATLAATKVMPFVRSHLFNVNGLAHKSENIVEYSYVDVSQNLGQIAQYNEIDENSQERLRNRAVMQIFPGLVPAEFDPRFYAIRNGAGLWVSAPYHELVEDQQVVRLRWRNRLQTKVGPEHNPGIRDWMIWESGVSYFPDAGTDNFGEDFGLLFGNYRWNLNDRTSFLADGVWDFFTNRQNYWNVGVLNQRSTRGSVYLAYRHVEARNFLDSEIVTASYSYQISPKWISTAAVAYDVGQEESRGSSLTLSRVGLDFVFHMGFGIDTNKDNVGIAFSMEPRLGPPSATNLSYLLGLQSR
ncbi:MAG: hypothetical protein MK102_07165 [Fuerstiella sp.]|nr:hypothetical protein [Fuerstiella sp.]